MGGKAHDGGFAGAVKRIVDVDGAAVWRADVAELFDLLQQFDDAAGFLDDQIGKLAVVGAGMRTVPWTRSPLGSGLFTGDLL